MWAGKWNIYDLDSSLGQFSEDQLLHLTHGS